MRSVDYLYEVIRKAPAGREGYLIDGKRYSVGAIPPVHGTAAWKIAICRWRYQTVTVMTDAFYTAEEAWEFLLSERRPGVLKKWKDREAQA